ncbi:hypothetical protein GCM10011369_09140 [Neiella marina]|uniref:N-acetyltransferase domain-containing protein n=1 Tax=Neiella marina TaxID=508461 RepID=A0A8J2U3G0_9GAMM|nr:GNAT family N-acetyltransferase [Neiella marina]GGA69662.1 hypothetical protein GCM10011369_09140 [Neiella marina]
MTSKMLELVEAQDLTAAAQFTLDNMAPYYAMYGVDWELNDVYQATKDLVNFNIVFNGQHIGVVRLSFEGDCCQLRDIQIGAAHQSKGFGAQVIAIVMAMAERRRLAAVELKVFQRSPAHKLYSRVGFRVVNKDDRFYYMRRSTAD